MRQAEEAELTATSAYARQNYTDKLDRDGLSCRRQSNHEHTGCRQCYEYEDSRAVGNAMDKVRCDQLGKERGDDIGEKDDAFWERTDEILSGGKDNHIEDIIDEA